MIGWYLLKAYISEDNEQSNDESVDDRYLGMSGPNGISPSVYSDSDFGREYLLSLLNKWIEDPETLPKSIGQHYVYQEYECGDRTQLCNYRKIFVANTEFTTLSNIIGDRLQKILAPMMPSENITLKEGSSGAEAIQVVQSAAKAVSAANTGGMFVFLDCNMLRNTVNHIFIKKALQRFGVPAKTRDLVLRMISILSIFPVLNGKPLPLVPMKCGLPSGNMLGRVLNAGVSAFFSHALKSFLISTDYPAVPGMPQHVVYEKGIAVFLSSPAALARLEKVIELYRQATGIVIRIKHCKVVQVGTGPDQAIPDNWTKIPREQKVKYFDSEFNMQA